MRRRRESSGAKAPLPKEDALLRAHQTASTKAKTKGPKIDKQLQLLLTPPRFADRQTQAAPLGLAGDTSAKKKTKQATTTGEKTRLTDKKKKEKQEAPAPPAASPSASAPQPDSTPSAPAPQNLNACATAVVAENREAEARPGMRTLQDTPLRRRRYRTDRERLFRSGFLFSSISAHRLGLTNSALIGRDTPIVGQFLLFLEWKLLFCFF